MMGVVVKVVVPDGGGGRDGVNGGSDLVALEVMWVKQEERV